MMNSLMFSVLPDVWSSIYTSAAKLTPALASSSGCGGGISGYIYRTLDLLLHLVKSLPKLCAFLQFEKKSTPLTRSTNQFLVAFSNIVPLVRSFLGNLLQCQAHASDGSRRKSIYSSQRACRGLCFCMF